MDKTSGGAVTRTVTYYPVAGAMRINSTLYYVLKDHLGSASVVTDASGTIVGEQRYYPYGETRFSTGTIYTDKLFTGQREMSGLGIYHYQARFYSPKLGRFLSADTIVPGYANPQALNRYSYVLGNPVRYTDPSGRAISCDAEEDCKEKRRVDKLSAKAYVKEVLAKYRVKIADGFSNSQSIAILAAVVKVGEKLGTERGLGESGSVAFTAVYNHLDVGWEGSPGMCGNVAADSGGCTHGAHNISFWSMSGQLFTDLDRMTKNVIHELGHAFDWTTYNSGDLTRASNHMSADFTRDVVLRPNPIAGRPDWQQSTENTTSEIFADMFTAWTYNAWNTSSDPLIVEVVKSANNWMDGLANP